MNASARSTFFFLACTILGAAKSASADTLYLKNGMYIVVTRAAEKDGQIDYWVGSTKYTISKELVAKIESGNGPSPSVHSATSITQGAHGIQDLTHREPDQNAANPGHPRLEMPVPGGPRQNEPYWIALRNRILQGDRVNEMKLAEIELDHDARTTSDAYFLAGVTEMQAGATGTASAYFERGLRAAPEQARLLEWHAIALSSEGKYEDAVHELEHAVDVDSCVGASAATPGIGPIQRRPHW